MEKITLARRTDDPDRVDLSEAALIEMDRADLTHVAHVDAVRAAEREFLHAVEDVQLAHKLDLDKAIKYVRDRRPRLFKLCRLDKSGTPGGAAIVVEARRV